MTRDEFVKMMTREFNRSIAREKARLGDGAVVY